jgi:hypothetical protein
MAKTAFMVQRNTLLGQTDRREPTGTDKLEATLTQMNNTLRWKGHSIHVPCFPS